MAKSSPANNLTEGMRSPLPEWMPLQAGPFLFRLGYAAKLGQERGPGWSNGQLLTKAAEFCPYSDTDNPNLHLLSMVDDEICIRVAWHLTIDTGHMVDLRSYFADELEAPDEILNSLAVKQMRVGNYLPREIESIETGVERLKFIWATIKSQFDSALSARTVRLMARHGSPTAPFEEVPHDAFQHYRITGWRLGTALPIVSGEGPSLYSIHVDPLSGSTPEAGVNDGAKGLLGPTAASYVEALCRLYPNGIPERVQTQVIEQALWTYMGEQPDLTRASGKEDGSAHKRQVHAARSHLGGKWAPRKS